MVKDFTPSTHDIYTNTLYFISLTLALSVSSVCILGKQWIREYQKDISVSARNAVRLRQARFDALEAWKVPQIVAALPVILLTALTLFFAGLLIQLWNSSDPTTAIAVSIVVACTTLLVIVTTVIPALCGMQRSRDVLTPFRSPQSWIIFVVYRRLRRWYHIVFDVYDEVPTRSTLANWSAFDHHFLETEFLYGPEISSVHRALRWVYDVLRNSRIMDHSVYWCLQKQAQFDLLVKSQDRLIHYVISGSVKMDGGYDNVHSLWYDYSLWIDKVPLTLEDPVARYQVELLIQSAYAVEHVADPWGEILISYHRLFLYGIFDRYWTEETVYRTYLHPHLNSFQLVFSDQHATQDQLALLFEWTFKIPNPPTRQADRNDIVRYLLETCHKASSPVALQILDDIVRRQIPQWIRINNSPSLLNDIGCAMFKWARLSWKHSFVLFVGLAEVMAEMSNEAESMSMWSELERIVTWNELEGVDELVDEMVLERWMDIHDWFCRRVTQIDEPKI